MLTAAGSSTLATRVYILYVLDLDMPRWTDAYSIHTQAYIEHIQSAKPKTYVHKNLCVSV